MKEWFRRFASATSDATGSWWAFMLAVLIVVLWFASGFFVQGGFQNTQNRDAKAIHLKLDELLRAVEGARTSMANLENMPDEELKRLQKEFQMLCETRGIGNGK